MDALAESVVAVLCTRAMRPPAPAANGPPEPIGGAAAEGMSSELMLERSVCRDCAFTEGGTAGAAHC